MVGKRKLAAAADSTPQVVVGQRIVPECSRWLVLDSCMTQGVSVRRCTTIFIQD